MKIPYSTSKIRLSYDRKEIIKNCTHSTFNEYKNTYIICHTLALLDLLYQCKQLSTLDDEYFTRWLFNLDPVKAKDLSFYNNGRL